MEVQSNGEYCLRVRIFGKGLYCSAVDAIQLTGHSSVAAKCRVFFVFVASIALADGS